MTQDPNRAPSKAPSPNADLDAQIQYIQDANRKTRLRWGAAGIAVMLTGVGLFVLFAEQKTYFFRPNPDMKEVEHYSNKQANDPICNALLQDVDQLEDEWTQHRVAMRDLSTSEDPKALDEGLKRIQRFQKTYTFQKRRIGVMVTKSQRSQTEISKYVTHVLSYLRPMEDVLKTRLQHLQAGTDPASQNTEPKKAAKTPKGMRSLEIPGLGKIAVPKPKPNTHGTRPDQPPEERYRKAWSAVTEDHDKWRVFRQGVSPCGERRGEVPELLDDDASLNDIVLPEQTTPEPKENAPSPAPEAVKETAP